MEAFNNVSHYAAINITVVVLALWALCCKCALASPTTNDINPNRWAFSKRHVHVTNDLFEGTPLNLRCGWKVGHGDPTVLQYKQTFEWGFHLKEPFVPTIYWCSMLWLDGNKQWLAGDFLVFDMQNAVPFKDCYDCYWSVRWDGIYSKEKDDSYVWRYGWTKLPEK